MSGLWKDELLAVFERAEIRSYQFVAHAQSMTDETYESGGSEESDDGSWICWRQRNYQGCTPERTGNMLIYRPTNYSRMNSKKNLSTPTNKNLFYLKIIHSFLYSFTAAVYQHKKEQGIKQRRIRISPGGRGAGPPESRIAAPQTHQWQSH